MLTLTLILGLVGLFSIPTATAGQAVAPPAAVSFDVNFQVSSARGGFTAELNGVANQSGDLRATLSTADPEAHSIDLIEVNKTLYLSADGGPFQENPDAGALSGLGVPGGAFARASQSAGGLPPGCQSSALAIGSVLADPSARSGFTAMTNIQDLGPASIDGATTEHHSGSIDIGQLLASPLVQQGIGQVLSSCGGGQAPELDPTFLQLLFAGSTMSMDTYIDPANDVPRQFDFTLDIQPLGLQFTADGVASQLASPALISAP